MDRFRHLEPVLWAVTMLAIAFIGIGRSESSLVSVTVAGILIAAAALVTVPASSGNRFSLALAAATAGPLLIGPIFDFGGAVGAVAVGFLSGWIVLQLFGSAEHLITANSDFLRQSFGAFLFAAAYVVLAHAAGMVVGSASANLMGAVGAALVWFAFETVAWALFTYDRVSRRYLIKLAVEDWPVAFSLFAVGALFAYVLPELGWWAPVVALLPYSFAHLAFYRSQESRRTYGQRHL